MMTVGKRPIAAGPMFSPGHPTIRTESDSRLHRKDDPARVRRLLAPDNIRFAELRSARHTASPPYANSSCPF
jgi:hypothetical protein